MSARVLIVDDLLPNVKLLEAKLSSEYYEVASAFSGAETLEKVKHFMPDIILLDVMMPGLDGFETCRRLKNDPETAHIPVVMVTALSDIQDRIHGLEVGADDFITKPINDVHLFARVKSLVRLKQMMDELRTRDETGSQLGLERENEAAMSFTADVKGHILIVDDDIVESKNIAETLNKAGNNVQICQPAEAIDVSAQHIHDLIIVSTQLADHDGLRLCSQIRSNEKSRHIPILILVDEDERLPLVKGLEMGVNDYLITPIESNELLARTRTQLRQKRYHDALRTSYQERLSLAIVDSLTKLYNRRYLDAHLQNIVERSMEKSRDLSVMTLDVDHFKNINDAPGFGHNIGDEVLRQISERILNNVRSTDLSTRPGGEEFVVVMPGTDIKKAAEIAERIRFNIASVPFKISVPPGEINSTISIGISSLRKDKDNAEALLKRSDEALYKAKSEGRNKVVVLE